MKNITETCPRNTKNPLKGCRPPVPRLQVGPQRVKILPTFRITDTKLLEWINNIILLFKPTVIRKFHKVISLRKGNNTCLHKSVLHLRVCCFSRKVVRFQHNPNRDVNAFLTQEFLGFSLHGISTIPSLHYFSSCLPTEQSCRKGPQSDYHPQAKN